MRGLRSHRGLAHHAIPGQLFEVQHVFEEEELGWFERLGELNCLERSEVLLGIVQQFRAETDLGAQMLEKLGNRFKVELLVEDPAPWSTPRPLALPGLEEASPAVSPQLDADVGKALLHRGANPLFDAFEGLALMRMIVDRHSGPATASQQLVERHVGTLGLDIPQGGIETRQRHVHRRIVAPKRTHVAGLPNVLDLVGIPSGDALRQNLDRRRNRAGTEQIRCGADPIQTRLTRLHLDDGPGRIGASLNRADPRNLQRRHAAPGLLFLRGQRSRARAGIGRGGSPAASRGRVKKIPAIHGLLQGGWIPCMRA